MTQELYRHYPATVHSQHVQFETHITDQTTAREAENKPSRQEPNLRQTDTAKTNSGTHREPTHNEQEGRAAEAQPGSTTQKDEGDDTLELSSAGSGGNHLADETKNKNSARKSKHQVRSDPGAWLLTANRRMEKSRMRRQGKISIGR
jgi:hypothetical protein